MKKGKLFNKLMVVMTGVLLGLLFALNNSMSITSYADNEATHYRGEYLGYVGFDNTTVLANKRNESIKSITVNQPVKTVFTSNACKASKALKDEKRKFVITKLEQFTIKVATGYRIRAVEFAGDVEGSVFCNNVSYNYSTTDEDKTYFYFENYDAPLDTLSFQAGSSGFEFKDIKVYYVGIETEAWITPPTTSLYCDEMIYYSIVEEGTFWFQHTWIFNIKVYSSNKSIMEAKQEVGRVWLTPHNVGTCNLHAEVPATSQKAKWEVDIPITVLAYDSYEYEIQCNDGFYTRCDENYKGEETPYVPDYQLPLAGWYKIPGWYEPDSKTWYTDALPKGFDKKIFGYYYSINHGSSAPSCTQNGVADYWYVNATVLNKTLYFKDEACTQEIKNFDEWKNGEGKIAATAHKLSLGKYVKNATCTSCGCKEYYHCSQCERDFKDKYGNIRINSIESWITNQGSDGGYIPARGHNTSHTEMEQATCEKDGCKEYWYCLNCKQYFSNAGCTNVISEDINTWSKIKSTGHSLSKTDEEAATCTKPGCEEYYHCSECDAYFDKDCEKITDIDEWKENAGKLPVIDHSLSKTDEEAASDTEDGCEEYYHCSECNTYFDKDGDEITNIEEWKKTEGRIAKPENPTTVPTEEPEPTETPTVAPTQNPEPTENPTVAPTEEPEPTENPTAVPSGIPTPTVAPTQDADDEIPVIGHDDKATPTEDPTPNPHVCKGEAVAEVSATCTESGTKAYYKCECNKCYEDEACTKEIADLNAWLAAEDGGKIAAKGHTVVTDKAVKATAKKNGLTEGTHCSVCNTVLTAQLQTIYTKEGIVTITSKNTVAYVAPVKTSVKTTEVPKTVKIKGKSYKVTAIREGAFKNCKKLTTVTVGSNVTTIGANAFAGCAKLKTVKLNSKVKTIAENAFGKCKSLTEIVITDKVTEIGNNAFDGCTKLKKVTIGKSVKTIGEKAFNGCKKLTNVKILSSKLTKVSADAFKGISSKAKITAPSKKVASYKKLIKASGAPSKVSVTKN